MGDLVGSVFGKSGKTAGLQTTGTSADREIEAQGRAGREGLLRPYLEQMRNGGSLKDAISSMSQDKGINGDSEFLLPEAAKKQLMAQAYQDPELGTKLATQQVQDNPITGQLFGKGGTLDRTNAEEQNLASQGFNLTPEDMQAYGQTAGNVARLFGQQEKGAASSLARRGLGGANSGAALSKFAGLQGNKNEQLAGAQMQIAQKRYADNMQRLGQTRNFLTQMGQQGQQAIQNQYGRSMSGINQGHQDLMDVDKSQQAAQQIANGAKNKEFENENSTEQGSIFGALGDNIKSQASGKNVKDAFGAAVKGGSSLFG